MKTRRNANTPAGEKIDLGKLRPLTPHQRVLRLAFCSLLSALGLLALYLGSLLDVLDLSAAVLASFTVIVAVIEYGRGAGWLVYAVVSALGLLLLQGLSLAALTFALFAGYYPILKGIFESRLRPLLRRVCKLVTFELALAALMGLSLTVLAEGVTPSPYLLLGFAALANLVFVVYDLALTRLISFYMFRLRKHLRR